MDTDDTPYGPGIAAPGWWDVRELPPPPGGAAGLSLTLREPPGAGARFDPSVPHPARVYDYWLGGTDHFPPDRRVAEQVIRERPQVVAGARANRAFLTRAVRYLAADCGIQQFLDIGTGLPSAANTHQVAQAIPPKPGWSTWTTTPWSWRTPVPCWPAPPRGCAATLTPTCATRPAS